MPTLEDLTIHKCLFPLPPDYLHLPLLVDRVVTLPALRLLQVSCHVTVAGAALLLRNLCFPGDVRVEIGETGWSEVEVSSQIGLGGHAEEEVAGCVLSALQYRLSGHDGLADPPPQLMSLHLDVQDGDELSFKGWSSILPDASPGSIASHEMQSALRFDVSCWPGGNMAEYFMDRLSLAPSLFGVRTIAISCSPYEVDVVLPTDTLASGFARLPEVQTVLVSGSPAVGPILTALRTPCGPEKRLPCPSLKTLHISGFSFARERADYELADHPMDYVVEHKNGFECIKRMITARYQQGFPIDSLIVSDCEVSQVEWIEQLSKLVRVVWDGNTSRAASEEPQPL
ncbi:hypothetical protein PsYK624_143460 [Phanerochaete sordida]|uniref:Uncharacterized protein n=1 Tax=Phanerochaete sordida TaxID=48140 RepID=A0A9P3LKY4_9APHY|nr:hypothetical protein PsYK624_143460 [Phanerochaete sordida]